MTFGIGTLLIGLALLVVVVALVMMPLLGPNTPPAQPASRRDALEAERAAIVRSIRDLDFDYRTHKVNEADYQALRLGLVQRGTDILRELDALEEAAPASAQEAAQDRDDDAALDAEIEAAVARLRQSAFSVAAPRAGMVCPACGSSVLPTDRFCAKCGYALRPQT